MSAKAKTGSRTKRQKIERHETKREEEQAYQLSRLERVPLEILAEILLYMNSPKDVLSVARCSKNLCATLLNPSNVMIWRRARAHCVVPGLPPPPPGWSESAYAAFIFDRGNCCGVSLDEYLQLENDIRRQRQILEHAKILHRWSLTWSHKYRDIRVSNAHFARKLATESGWNLEDLLATPTYGSLHRNYGVCLEAISDGDVRLLLTRIDAEILSKAENTERRQRAHAQQFRELPIINALQDRDDSMPVVSTRSSSARLTQTPRVLDSELRCSKLIGNMVDSDIKKWADAALAAFDSLLGQPNWKSASTKFLHPAERVTARFICTLCSSPPQRCATVESLDFREACAHQCVRHSKTSTAKKRWCADQFVVDQKAIAVLSQAVSLVGLRAENRDSVDELERKGAVFGCKSCNFAVVMNFQRLARHCHRHEEMQVRLISRAEGFVLGINYPYEAGSFARYSARSKEAKEMAQMKVFGCRHCQRKATFSEIMRPSRNEDNHSSKRFTFNGLISHAKEKHKIFPWATRTSSE
ncbi:hypothetical protein BC826DRAFT_1004776, partial [Russula brevipes]